VEGGQAIEVPRLGEVLQPAPNEVVAEVQQARRLVRVDAPQDHPAEVRLRGHHHLALHQRRRRGHLGHGPDARQQRAPIAEPAALAVEHHVGVVAQDLGFRSLPKPPMIAMVMQSAKDPRPTPRKARNEIAVRNPLLRARSCRTAMSTSAGIFSMRSKSRASRAAWRESRPPAPRRWPRAQRITAVGGVGSRPGLTSRNEYFTSATASARASTRCIHVDHVARARAQPARDEPQQQQVDQHRRSSCTRDALRACRAPPGGAAERAPRRGCSSAREQHHQAIDAEAEARGGRHPVRERADVVGVVVHRLVVAPLTVHELRRETARPGRRGR
jgi:hypothetical protein